MSDANRVALLYETTGEGTYGEWPATPALQAIQFTSESLKADTSTLRSEVIRSDRNSPYIARNDYGGSGDIGIEMQWSAYDTLMQWALLSSAWSTGTTAAAKAVTSVSSNVVTFSAYDPTTDFALYEWVRITDAGTTAPNDGKVGRITALSSTTMTLDCVSLTDETTKTWSLKETDFISNGVTLVTFDIEKAYEDLTNIFAHYTGCAMNMFGYGWESDGLITGTFGLLMKGELSATSSKDGTPTAAVGNPSLNAIDDVMEFYLNGGTTPINHTAFRWDLNNNLRGRKRVGTLGPFEMGTGTAEVNGSLTQHFLDSDMMDEYLSFNTAELHAKIDCQGLGMYILDLPAVKFSSGQRVAGGRNQDVMGEMAYEAYYDTTVGHTVKIHRISYA